MKLLIIAILSFFTFLSSLKSQVEEVNVKSGQHDSIILYKAINEIVPGRHIYYVDSVKLNRSFKDRYKENFLNGTVTDKKRGISLTLSSVEQDFILSQMEQQIVWSENLFSNSTRIRKDSIWSFLEKKNLQRTNAINIAKSQNDDKAVIDLKEYPFIFEFAKPIYLRNNTLCFVIYTASCGTECGQTEMSFYKKEDDEWFKLIVVSASEF